MGISVLYVVGGVLLASAVGALGFVSSLDEAHARAVDAERASAGLPPKPVQVRSPSTMSGTCRSPPESARKRRSASGSRRTSW